MARKSRDELLDGLLLGLREQASRTLMFHQAIAERAGLGPTDMKALDLARSEPTLTAGRLAAITGLSTSATTALLDRLERRGFVERRRDPTDRRKVVIVPVPDAGPAETAAVFGDIDTWVRSYLSDQDDRTLEFLVRFVADINTESARLTATITTA
ncbi:MarR family transcriptional regulator [Actinomycetospora endophytica]|uniref:MarR family transcriptional regulator n=1 Tax=Actinomycetospora endophytica TaxID=2291215 RepID=A0ABS8P1B3_9PSEU|nr:MarR family transcriptional regulator [Actinomycetospora endophytica]MCD2191848.1 MarR family transcriptional regulator [Actinomycetospora endophytica]